MHHTHNRQVVVVHLGFYSFSSSLAVSSVHESTATTTVTQQYIVNVRGDVNLHSDDRQTNRQRLHTLTYAIAADCGGKLPRPSYLVKLGSIASQGLAPLGTGTRRGQFVPCVSAHRVCVAKVLRVETYLSVGGEQIPELIGVQRAAESLYCVLAHRLFAPSSPVAVL